MDFLKDIRVHLMLSGLEIEELDEDTVMFGLNHIGKVIQQERRNTQIREETRNDSGLERGVEDPAVSRRTEELRLSMTSEDPEKMGLDHAFSSRRFMHLIPPPFLETLCLI